MYHYIHIYKYMYLTYTCIYTHTHTQVGDAALHYAARNRDPHSRSAVMQTLMAAGAKSGRNSQKSSPKSFYTVASQHFEKFEKLEFRQITAT